MEEADMLCDELFRWLENRKKCARKLEKLAEELEDVHEGSNIVQVVGAGASVGAFSGALLATVVTGGLASPLLAAATVSLAGTAAIVTSTLLEILITSSTFKKANKLIKEDEKVGMKIQDLLRDLKARCGEALLGAHADELDCEMATQLMCALARRSNTHVPLDLLRGFNRATFFRHMTPGGLAPAEATHLIGQALGLDHFSEITSSLKVSAKEMALGTLISFVLSLHDLIVKIVELVKGNRVTEACKFLRDSARQILDSRQKLKGQLDAMQEIIPKLFTMKRFIKDLGEYSLMMTVNEQNIMKYIKGTCRDDTVLSWLERLPHQIEFVNLLRFFKKRLSPIPEDLTKPGGGHLDIVFVAHGGIVDRFMPAGGLVPTPNIRDTILYSPWNCAIDANAAFAIAEGFIHFSNRKFYFSQAEVDNMAHCEPNPLPRHWNSMRESLHNIPGIHLAPVNPEDKAWIHFQKYWKNRMEINNRVIIPYLLPKDQVNAFGKIPLYMFIFVTSFLLMLHGKTATLHLAACLSRRKETPERPVQWRTQYAYTRDGVWMSVDMGNRNVDSELYRAFTSMFDRNSR